MKDDLEGAKKLLSPDVPFVIGGDPDRVAPAHVINGYLAALFGTGASAGSVRQAMRGKIDLPDSVSEEIRSSERKTIAFREVLRTILDPDHRVFPSGQGSVFPLSLGIVAPDRSDDGLGKELAWLVSSVERNNAQQMARLFHFNEDTDAVSRLGAVLSSNYELNVREQNSAQWPWIAAGGPFGRELTHSLASLVLTAPANATPVASISLAILTRSCYLAVFLGLVRSAAIMARGPASWSDLAPMFCLGVQPPGNPRSPEGRLAIRSFDAVVAECVEAIQELVTDRLVRSGRGITQNMPPSERARIRIWKAFPGVRDEQKESAAKAIRRYDRAEAQGRALARLAYPAKYVAAAMRSTGRMIGMAGPDRGAGAPRFLVETPLLALLVQATAEGAPLRYAKWLDRVFERFGLIFGFGESYDHRSLLRTLDDDGPIEQALRANHEALRMRLIRAGLAVEYSDGETEIVRSEA